MGQDGNENGRVRLNRVRQRLPQHRQLSIATHNRRLGPGHHRLDPQHAEGGHALGLALQGERLDRLRHDLVAHETEGGLADQDPTRLGR